MNNIMNDILVQTLKGEVTPDIPFDVYGAIKINIRKLNISNPGLSLTLYNVDGCEIVSYGGSFTVNGVKYTTYTPHTNSVVITVDNSDYVLYVKDTKYRTDNKFACIVNANSVVAIDLSVFEYTKVDYIIATSFIGYSQMYGKFMVSDFNTISNINLKSKDAIFDIDEFANNTTMVNLQIPESKSIGNISSLSKMINCSNINLNYTNIDGIVEDMADGLVQNGKISGTIRLQGNGTNITNRNGVNITDISIKFGSSMIDPTLEETARGYQIA